MSATKTVIGILSERDDMSPADAKDFLNEVLAEIQDLIDQGLYTEAEDMWLVEMGLEPDYLMDILMEVPTIGEET